MNQHDSSGQNAAPKKPWQRPTLVVHGDAKALTEVQTGAGGSIGRGALGRNGPHAS